MDLFRRRPTLPPGRRIYAIGDVHGRFDLLGELITRICSREGPFGTVGLTILLLGDLIDRGPKSAQVINLVRKSAQVFPEVITLKGNHEDAMVAAWRGDREALASWLEFGGTDTLLSFGVDRAVLDSGDIDALISTLRVSVPEETIDWLDSLPLNYACGDYLFVHAGIRPGLPLDQQEPADFLWIRDEFLEYVASHGPMIVHGHTISDEVDFRRNRIGVDIGAYQSGRLAALRLEGTQRKVVIADGTPRLLG